MIPKSKRYVPPSDRPPNAPTKKEIDDLTTDHIGGYTTREIRRLIEIHKHFVDFHYEPQNSDGGLIADDGTDPLYYYQSNLPQIQRMISSRKIRSDDSDDDDDEEAMAADIELRLQDLRDGVANNAIVAMEKGKLSKTISVQKFVARNLQNTNAIVDELQEHQDVFEVDADERDRIDGQGSLPLQMDMMQTILKFRRDTNNQLKKLIQCLAVKVADLSAAVESASPAVGGAGRRGPGGRLRMATNAVLRASSDPSKGTGAGANGEMSEGDVDMELLRELATEVQYLRKEQEYMYFRLYGIKGSTDAKERAATSTAPAGAGAGKGISGALASSSGQAAAKPGAQKNNAQGAPSRGPPRGPGGAPPQRMTPTEQFHQGPIESHPDFPNFLQRTEKTMRMEMEAVYQSMVASESAKLFASNTKGADVLRKLSADIEDYKAMIENMHHQVLSIFEPGRQALKANRCLESHQMGLHDVTAYTKPLEKVVAVRGIKEFVGDGTPVGRALQALNTKDIEPALTTQTLSAVELLASELTRLGNPISEDSLERMCLSVGCASDALKHLAMKICGALMATVTMFPPSVSLDCGEAVSKLMRALVPQWTEEALTKFGIDMAEKEDNYHVAGALSGIKDRNEDLRRLTKQSRGSSRHRTKPGSRGAGGDPCVEGEPLPDGEGGFDSDEGDSEFGDTRSKHSRTGSARPPSSRHTATPIAVVQAHREIQCEIMRWQPPSARSEASDGDRVTSASQRSGSGSITNRRRSATPHSARSASSAPDVGDDAFTQTEPPVVRVQASQTEDNASPSRMSSAKQTDGSPKSASPLSRPISAMKLANPLVENEQGVRVPLIPHSGAIAVASIHGIHVLWQECPSTMPSLMEAYTSLLRDEALAHHGLELRCDDDAFLAVFASEVDALQWAVSVQLHAMYLPYPAEMLLLAEAAAVPHPSMLGGPVGVPSPLYAEAKVAAGLDASHLQKWTWRGFRVQIALHCGKICTNEPPLSANDEGEVNIGGPHLAFAAKVGLLCPGGSTIASSSFIHAVEKRMSESQNLQVLSGCLSFIKWEEVPSPTAIEDEGGDNGKETADAVEVLVCVVPEALKYRRVGPDVAPHGDGTDAPTSAAAGTMVQRWACDFVHQVEVAHRGRNAKLAFVVVEVESAKHFPHYNGAMLREASHSLVEEATRHTRTLGGTFFAVTDTSMVATFENPIAAGKFALSLHLLALQYAGYPSEVMMIPSCKEQYEESALTWRGLRVRAVGHYGPAGPVLRHLSTRRLEYFGPTLLDANEISAEAPFGCFACTPSMFSELSLYLDLLEDPVVFQASPGLHLLLPTPLLRREATMKAAQDAVRCQPTYSHHVFQITAFDGKKHLAEYSAGVKTAKEVAEAGASEPTLGIMAVTQHSILSLWKEDDSQRVAFEVRLAAAIEEERNSGKVSRKLPTRRDCRDDILRLAIAAEEAVEALVTQQFGGYVAAECKSAFLTTVYVFPTIGQAVQCALKLQLSMHTIMQPLVPETLKEKLERVYSAESGQVVMEGVRVGIALHSGSVRLVHTSGCREWCYHGAALHQCAAVAHKYACPGESILTHRGIKTMREHCGPSDLDGHDVDSFFAKEAVLQTLMPHMLPPGEEPPCLVGDLLPSVLYSVVPASQAERLVYFLRTANPQSAELPVSDAALSTKQESASSRRNRERALQSKYGFAPLRTLRTALQQSASASASQAGDKANDALTVQGDKPTYLWNAMLVQRVYRAVWRVAAKASRVMGYPMDVDVDPSSFDAPMREATQQTGQLVTAFMGGEENIDFSDVLEMRGVMDDAAARVLQRSEEHLIGVLTALSVRLDKPQAMHRSMQSAIIIPPNDKDDAALYKTTEVGAGKRVTPSSRPASRERSGTPTTPTLGLLLGVGGGTPSSTPIGFGTNNNGTMISVGTENPRFLSAGRRPNSRRSSTPTGNKVEQGTQLTPADVPSLVAMALPNALMVQERHHWTTPASLFRPGIGVDIATMRIKERRIMELEREVEKLHEEQTRVQNSMSAAASFDDTQHPVMLALRAASSRGSTNPNLKDGGDRSAALIGTLLEWQQREHQGRMRPTSLPPLNVPPPLEHNAPAAGGGGYERLPTPNLGRQSEQHRRHSLDDDGIDFSQDLPAHRPVAATQHQQQQRAANDELAALQLTDEYDQEGEETSFQQPHALSAIASSFLGSRYLPPPQSRQQHWRRSSPLAPLQSSFTTTFQDGGLLVSGGVSSKIDLVSPFSAAATSVPRRTAKTPLPTTQSHRGKKPAHRSAATPTPTVAVATHEAHTIPSRPQSGDPQ